MRLKPKFLIILVIAATILSITYISLEDRQDTIIIDPRGTDAYKYPIRPGTPKWKALSYPERIDACQIPQDTLKAMSTEGLVITILNYPLYMNIMAFNTPQQGFEFVARRFNGLEELLKREDAGSELLKRYKEMNPDSINKNWNAEQKFLFVQAFDDIEIILCQDEILEDLSGKDLMDFFIEAKDKYEKKQQSEIFSMLRRASTARAMGKAMEHAQYKQFQEELAQSKALRDFLQYGGFPSDTVLTKIETYAEKERD